ncbi:MAG: HEAT repeat domain-containing protein [Bacteroidota bacterium]|nr:HEAT repeat domain-containing protein [Bacteroidota bacterium]
MRFKLLTILSLLLFASVQADPPLRPPSNSNKPEPIYIMDGAKLITSDADNPRLDNLISLAKNIYPIQIGAFRVKTYAEIMFARVAKVLGNDVVMVEEDGFFKIRVTKLNRDKLRSYIRPAQDEIKRDPQEPLNPETVQPDFQPDDTAAVSDTSSVIKASANDTSSVVANAVKPAASELPIVVPRQEPQHRLLFFNSESPWLKRINYFGKSVGFVNALIITIMISIGTMIILLMVILLNRTRMEKIEDLKQYLAETYQGMIIDYLFTGSSPDRFRTIASDNFRRQALIDQMIDVSVNLKGDAEEKLGGLYLYLGLDRDSIRRANNYRWHKKIKGFRELAFMNIKDANNVIYRALNSRNEILRMEAQIALVRLSDEDPFGFLFQLTRPFSLWEQITLHELIIQHDIPVPEFRKYLKASNPTVVMFALRMIREFKQKDAEDDVRETLDHPSPDIRRLAVQVAGDLEMRSTLEVMKRMYKNQDYNTCLEIIRAMAKMPDVSLLGFLRLVLDKEDDVQLQIEATKAIENQGEEGVRTLVKLMKSEYKNYNIIVRHVLDRRIY